MISRQGGRICCDTSYLRCLPSSRSGMRCRSFSTGLKVAACRKFRLPTPSLLARPYYAIVLCAFRCGPLYSLILKLYGSPPQTGSASISAIEAALGASNLIHCGEQRTTTSSCMLGALTKMRIEAIAWTASRAHERPMRYSRRDMLSS